MFKRLLHGVLLLAGCFGAATGHAQQSMASDITFQVLRYYHDYQCTGDDGGLPDPRFILEYRTNTDVDFQSYDFNIGNNIPCYWQPYTEFSRTFPQVCSGMLQLRLQGWEEDGFGSDRLPNTGDENFGALAVDPYVIDLNAISNPYTTTLELTNGYKVEIKITKAISVPYTAITLNGNDTLCYDGSRVLTANATSPAILGFKWYKDSLANGLGGNWIATGSSLAIDSTFFSYGSNHTRLYVSGVLGSGTCESQLKRIDIYRRPLPGKPQVADTAMAICYQQQAVIPVSNYNSGEVIEGFINGDLSSPAGPPATAASFVTYPMQQDAYICLRKKNSFGCAGLLWDTIHVRVTQPELPPHLDGATVCQGDTIELRATLPVNNRFYTWNDGNGTVLQSRQSAGAYDSLVLNHNTAAGTFVYQVHMQYPNALNTGTCTSATTAATVIVYPASRCAVFH